MSSSSVPEGSTLGYLHRLGRSEHTPPSPLTPEQHRHLIYQWNPSIAATVQTPGDITTTSSPLAIHKVIEEGAFRLQLKASRGVRYEQPLAALVRYSSLVREWLVAEGITVGATEEAPPAYSLPQNTNQDDGAEQVPSLSSRKTVQLSPLMAEEDGSSSAPSTTAAACDYLCRYHDDTVIILRTTRLSEVSTTSPTMCAPINSKKPVAVYRLEMMVEPSDRPKNVQQSDMAGELMLDSQFLGMMFNYVKKFHKAQCEMVEPPVLPALLRADGGSDELLPGQKKKICQIVEVLGLWDIFEEVHGRFRREIEGGGVVQTAAEPNAEDTERREEDLAETAKLVEKTMMIAKAKAGETVEIPGGTGKVASSSPTGVDAVVEGENAEKSAKGRSVKEHQAHLEWVESFRNKVKALRNFDNAYEDTKDARLAALRRGPTTTTNQSSTSAHPQEYDSDSDEDGMSAMLLGVGCPLCGRQGHPMAECPYSQ